MIKQLWIDIKYIRQPRKRLLHHILNNHLNAVEQMIQNGTDPNPTPEEIHKNSNLFWTDFGELHCPPLFAAVRSGSTPMVELLLKHAAPSICVPRSMFSMINGVQNEDIWHINAVDYLIEFARGQLKLSMPQAVLPGQSFKPEPPTINPVEEKIQDYLEIYKLLRVHVKPNNISEEWLEQFPYSHKPLAPFKNLEEEEILKEQNRRILAQIEHDGVEKRPRKV